MKIADDEAVETEKDNMDLVIFSGEEHGMNGDIVHVTCDNSRHPPFIDHRSDYHYYVTDGSGAFTIDGETCSVEAGDVVVVEAGTEFWYEGDMEMVLFTHPTFDPDEVEYR